MKLLDSKTKRQEEGISKWRFNKGVGIFHYYMGFGKTYTTVLLLKKLFEVHPDENVVILVPSEILYKQWRRTLKQHFNKEIYEKIKVYTANSLILNSVRTTCYLLIVDEIHEFYSEERIGFINRNYIGYKFVAGLTGTLKDVNNRYKIVTKFIPVVDVITKQDCEVNGWISKYKEYNVACKLSFSERLMYDHYSAEITQYLPKFGKNGLDIAQKCLNGGVGTKDGVEKQFTNYAWACMLAYKNNWRDDLDLTIPENEEINKTWHPKLIIGYARKVMMAIKARKDIIYNAESKFEGAVALLKKYPELKTIVFNQSTHMADKFYDIVPNCEIYHSKLPTVTKIVGNKEIKLGKTRRKAIAIQNIQSGAAKAIITVNSLGTGFDVPDLSMAIATSGTQNPFQHEQKSTRVTRLNLDKKNETVLIVNFYIESTKEEPSVDEKWLKKRQSTITHNIYWVDSVDEVEYDNYDRHEELFNGA